MRAAGEIVSRFRGQVRFTAEQQGTVHESKVARTLMATFLWLGTWMAELFAAVVQSVCLSVNETRHLPLPPLRAQTRRVRLSGDTTYHTTP